MSFKIKHWKIEIGFWFFKISNDKPKIKYTIKDVK